MLNKVKPGVIVQKCLSNTRSLLAALGLVGLAGCGVAPAQPDSSVELAKNADVDFSTILLVSLNDGSIIRQTINLDADICIKMLENVTTTCLTKGGAIVNNLGVVVGYEMISETIQLHGHN